MDKNYLRGKMAAKAITQTELAKTIGMSSNSLSRKMNAKKDFTLGEVQAIKDALELDSADVLAIFFK